MAPNMGIDMLDTRRSEIVRALVEEHIRTGEPVSSRAILETSGLQVSPATVRNELAALEAEGYVQQPHTSAGRVPTTKAYRYYVDQAAPQKLRGQTTARINDFFSSVHYELSRLLKSTTNLLSEVTHYPAVVVGPGLGGEHLRGVHLVQLSAQVVLVVFVGDSGSVTQEVARLSGAVQPSEVESAERVIRQNLLDRPMPTTLEVDTEAGDEPVPDRVRRIVDAALEAANYARELRRELYVGGTSQMPDLWEDLSKVHRVLELLDREAVLLELMAGIPLGTAVRIGRELGLEDDVDMALVTTSYDVGEDSGGRVGVIGPMRMNYPRTIRAVEEIGDGLADRLGSQEAAGN
ncbi:MAG: heat-inducible transcriptional repressor HrcA [Acidimicrobiia bacterium]|nr:heat-inducible transcriptional repressor HrcA [Acidimicrobiia bacterium]